MIDKIYLDMDGVLVDLNKRLEEILPKYHTHNPGDIPSKIFWDTLEEYSNFFRYLEPLPHYNTLFNYIKSLPVEIEILTSIPIPKGNLKTVGVDKEKWIRKYVSKTMKVNVVCGGSKKSKFATPNSLLIDDLERNTEAFLIAGGNIILHTSIPNTIAILDKIFN